MTITSYAPPFVEFHCFHDEVNVSVVRTPLVNDDTVKVKYFVMSKGHEFVPITVDFYLGEEFLAAFQCENGSLVDGGAKIGEVIFAGRCGNPTVIIYSNVTIPVQLDLNVILSDQEQTCGTVIIGPQSKYIYCTVYKFISFSN